MDYVRPVALETTPDKPAPVRVIANTMSGYINRLGPIWVEGQIAQLTRRPHNANVYLTLRDPLAEVSLQVMCPRAVVDAMPVPITEGARVVVYAKFQYYVPRGSLTLSAREIRPIGMGELLARIEQRRQLLAAEGLFETWRKRPLPFLPRLIGLIVGRDSAAERDVVDNTTRRWPGVRFRVEHTAVQGHDAARQIIEALHLLDADAAVDVVVIARGGGSVEDLLPFSDEGLLRAVSAAATPVVSAIGHETDQPLLDLVADVRASTPTDAAKRIVPDRDEETARVTALRDRGRIALASVLERERAGLDSVRARPVMAQPHAMFDQQAAGVRELRDRARRHIDHRLAQARSDLDHGLARVRALAPLATLSRGYAIVQKADGSVVTDSAQLAVDEVVTARFAVGRAGAQVREIHRDDERRPRHARTTADDPRADKD
jgi:exodeoxyribonuclease VII large subunit